MLAAQGERGYDDYCIEIASNGPSWALHCVDVVLKVDKAPFETFLSQSGTYSDWWRENNRGEGGQPSLLDGTSAVLSSKLFHLLKSFLILTSKFVWNLKRAQPFLLSLSLQPNLFNKPFRSLQSTSHFQGAHMSPKYLFAVFHHLKHMSNNM